MCSGGGGLVAPLKDSSCQEKWLPSGRLHASLSVSLTLPLLSHTYHFFVTLFFLFSNLSLHYWPFYLSYIPLSSLIPFSFFSHTSHTLSCHTTLLHLLYNTSTSSLIAVFSLPHLSFLSHNSPISLVSPTSSSLPYTSPIPLPLSLFSSNSHFSSTLLPSQLLLPPPFPWLMYKRILSLFFLQT